MYMCVLILNTGARIDISPVHHSSSNMYLNVSLEKINGMKRANNVRREMLKRERDR